MFVKFEFFPERNNTNIFIDMTKDSEQAMFGGKQELASDKQELASDNSQYSGGKPHKMCDYSLTAEEVFLVADAEVAAKGLVDHHISSANDLYGIGIQQIVEHVFELDFMVWDFKKTVPEEEEEMPR